jgi:hypothetical protein
MIYAQYLQSICGLLAETRDTERAPVNRNIELQLGEVNGSDEERLERDLFTYLEFIKRNACCASSNIVGDHGHVGRSDVRTDG